MSETGRKCVECGELAISPTTIEYSGTRWLDRKSYHVHIPSLPVEKCATCGEVWYGAAAHEALQNATRIAAGLLVADEILEGMQAIGAESQKVLAEWIGIAPETLSRWVTGESVQGRLANTMLQVFFGVPEARSFLRSLRRGEIVRFYVKPDPQWDLTSVGFYGDPTAGTSSRTPLEMNPLRLSKLAPPVVAAQDDSNRGYALAA